MTLRLINIGDNLGVQNLGVVDVVALVCYNEKQGAHDQVVSPSTKRRHINCQFL